MYIILQHSPITLHIYSVLFLTKVQSREQTTDPPPSQKQKRKKKTLQFYFYSAKSCMLHIDSKVLSNFQ